MYVPFAYSRGVNTPTRAHCRVPNSCPYTRSWKEMCSTSSLYTAVFCMSRGLRSKPPLRCLKPWTVVQSLSRVSLFATPWTAAHQASLSFTSSQRLLKVMPIESLMPSSHLILCRPLLFLPSVFPSIRAFSKESALCITWPESWNFSLSPSNECSGYTQRIHPVY